MVALSVVSVLLAALLAFSALRKLTHREDVVESYSRAGVPEERLDLLAAILLAACAGLLAGLWWTPLGIVTAAALTIYFMVAVAFHVRAHDVRHAPTPTALLLLAVAALGLQVA